MGDRVKRVGVAIDGRKPCPKCDAMAYKAPSCSHMTCPYCGCGWCWLCLKETIHGKIEHLKGGYCSARGLGRRMNSRDATNALLRDRGLRHGMNVNMMAQLKKIPMRPKPLSEDDEKLQKPKFEDDEKLQKSSYRDTS